MNASSRCGLWVQAVFALVLAVPGVNPLAAAEPGRPVASHPDIEVARLRLERSGVRAASLLIEGEALVATARASAGFISAQEMGGFGSGWAGGAQLFWQPPDPVDTPTRNWPSMTLYIDVVRGARYALAILHTRAPDYGDVRVFVGGQAVADLSGHAGSVQAA